MKCLQKGVKWKSMCEALCNTSSVIKGNIKRIDENNLFRKDMLQHHWIS